VTEPTIKKAYTALVVVGSAAAGLVMMSGAIALSTRMLGMSPHVVIESVLTVVAGLGAGGYGYTTQRKKAGS